MNPDEVSTLYITQAEELEAQGRFKEAEKYVMTLFMQYIAWSGRFE